MIKASVWDIVSASGLLVGGAVALGYLISLPVLRKHDSLKALFGCFALGLLIINTYVLLGGTLSSLPVILGIATIVGIGVAIWHRRFRKAKYRLTIWHIAALFVFSALAIWLNLHLLERIFYEPIYQWDAKAMWQLRAKQIYYTNGIQEITGFSGANASHYNPHPAYPTLLPVIGAYMASYVGFWNEFVPKANLFVLFLGLIIGLCSARSLHWVWKVVFVVLMLGFNPYMMTIGYTPLVMTLGYIDGWLSIYSALTLLWLVLYVRQGNKEYLFNAVANGALLATMKNEGLVIFLLLFGVFVISTLAFNLGRRKRLLFHSQRLIRLWPIILVSLAPTILWSWYKKKWGSGGDDYDFSLLFQPDKYDSVFNGEKIALIQQEYTNRTLSGGFWQFYLLLLVVAIGYGFTLGLKKPVWVRLAHEWTLSIVSGIAFVVLMNVVYCASIRDIKWHLSTSSDRLGLHSYYIFGIGIITLGALLHHLPFRRTQAATIKATPAQRSKLVTAQESHPQRAKTQMFPQKNPKKR